MAKTTKSAAEVTGVLAAAKLRGKATEIWAMHVTECSDCQGSIAAWWKRPKPTKKIVCDCGCAHVMEIEYDCCNSDMNLSDTFSAADLHLEKNTLKKLVIAAVAP